MAPPRKKRRSTNFVAPDEEEEAVQETNQQNDDNYENEENEEEENEEPEAPSAAKRALDAISPENFQRMVNTAMLYALSMEHTRRSIKKVDLKKFAIKPYYTTVSTPIYREVFRRTQARLRTMFGMELAPLPAREIPRELMVHAPSKAKKKEPAKRKELVEGQLPEEEDESNNDAFILRNILPLQYRLAIGSKNSKSERHYDGMIQILVMLVALRDGVLPKTQLEDIFKQMGFDSVDTFEAVISKMRRDRYMDQAQEQINREQSVSKVYLLPRAKVEFTAGSMAACYKQLLRDTMARDVDDEEKERQQQQFQMACEQFNKIFGAEKLEEPAPHSSEAPEAHASD